MLNGNKKNKQGLGCGTGIFGTLLVVVAVVVFAIISSLINRLFAYIGFGTEAAGGLYPLSQITILVAFIAFEAVFILWLFKGAKNATGDREEIKKLAKLTKIVTVIAIVVPLLFSVVSANVYTKCSEKSISKVVFATTKEYRWDDRCDVLCYNLTIDNEGNTGFTVMMNDGEVVDLFKNTNSCSASFKEKFESDKSGLWGYASYLAKDFATSCYLIEGRITGYEYLEKVEQSYPDIYPYVKEIAELIKSAQEQ